MSSEQIITEEMVEYLSDSPGETMSGSMSLDGPNVFRPKATHAIDPVEHAVRPQIGGHTSGKEKIRRPSADLPRRLDEGDKAMKAAAQAQAIAEAEAREIADPTNINSRIAYLERSNKKLTTSLNKLIKKIDSLTYDTTKEETKEA